MTQLSISMPPALQNWVDARLAEGGYVDAADYLRDLVRRDQDDHAADIRRVRALIEEGLGSGIIDREPEEVLNEIIAGIPSSHG